MGVVFIGCFHMMSPQKGPQRSFFQFLYPPAKQIVKGNFGVI